MLSKIIDREFLFIKRAKVEIETIIHEKKLLTLLKILLKFIKLIVDITVIYDCFFL